MTEQVCDPTTGVCELPKTEKKEKIEKNGRVSDIELLKLTNISTLLDDKGSEVKIDSLSPTPLVLLYFSASWCPPCRSFTPKLVNFLKKQTQLHCILVSCDRTPEKYLDYLTNHCQGMYAIPYTPESMRTQLMSALGISGIPCLVVMDSKGKIITTSGRMAVEYNSERCVEEWLQGNPGTSIKNMVNLFSIFFYVVVIALFIWWMKSGPDKGGKVRGYQGAKPGI